MQRNAMRRMSQRSMIITVIAALLVLTYQVIATKVQHDEASTAAVALAELPAVRVADPDPARPAYEREHYQPHGWIDADGDGCNTRREVLIQESTKPVTVNPDGCKLSNGEWKDRFAPFETNSDQALQIDHLVALADAHRSGAWQWPDEKKIAFANDLDNPDELNALSSSNNQAKSDKGPDEWMPEGRAAKCDYLRSYVTIKAQWQLTVDPQQWSAIAKAWPACTSA
jgi:hypothetical protein